MGKANRMMAILCTPFILVKCMVCLCATWSDLYESEWILIFSLSNRCQDSATMMALTRFPTFLIKYDIDFTKISSTKKKRYSIAEISVARPFLFYLF